MSLFYEFSHLGNHLLNVGPYLIRCDNSWVKLDDFAVGIYKELAPWPGYRLCHLWFSIIELWVSSQIVISFMCVRSIYVNLLKDWELRTMLASCNFNNISSTSLFLVERVAWEAKYLQATTSQIFIHLYQLRIVLVSQASCWCEVYYKNSLLTLHEVWYWSQLILIDFSNLDIKEWVMLNFLKVIALCVRYTP